MHESEFVFQQGKTPPYSQVQGLAALAPTTLDASLTLVDNNALLATDLGWCGITWADLSA